MEAAGTLLGALAEVEGHGVQQVAEQVHLGEAQGGAALVEVVPHLAGHGGVDDDGPLVRGHLEHPVQILLGAHVLETAHQGELSPLENWVSAACTMRRAVSPEPPETT